MTNAKDGEKGWLRNFFRALGSLRKTCVASFRRRAVTMGLMLATSSSKVTPQPIHWSEPLLTEKEWVALTDALIYVESRGYIRAHNKKENARGCLQVRESVMVDFNRHNLRPFTHDDMFTPWHAKRVCRWYLDFYGRKWMNKHPEHDQCVQQVLARIWNGGPMGPSKGSTVHYWHMVSQHL